MGRKNSVIFVFLSVLIIFGVLGVVSAADLTVCSSGCDYTSIQDAINNAVSGEDTIEVGAGTYEITSTLNINKGITLIGESEEGVVIDARSIDGYGIYINADDVTVESLTLIGPQGGYDPESPDWNDYKDNYGFKISQMDNLVLRELTVQGSGNSEIDLNTVNTATIEDIEADGEDTPGFGLMIFNSNDITVIDITTNNNGWAGVSIQNKGQIVDNIIFSGEFNVNDNFPLLIEEDPQSGVYYDITNVDIPDDFNYIVYDFREGDDYKQWYYFETLEEAKTIAQAFAESGDPIYSDILIYDIDEENYYVEEGMLIQDAIDAASEDDTINVGSGEFAGAIIDESVKIIGEEDGTSIIISGVAYKPGNTAHMSAFRPDANGAEIRNFVIDCSEDMDLGVYAKGIDNIIVDSLIINSEGTVQGITNWGGSNWIITNNIITNTVASGGGGIGIFLGAVPPNYYSTSSDFRICTGNLVQNNQISATATAEGYSTPGIFVGLDLRFDGYDELDGTEDVSGNQILDNIITSSGANNGVGIEVGTILGDSESDPERNDATKIAALMATGAVHDNILQDNIIDGAETGLYFYIVTNLTINQNEVRNSVENGIYAEYPHKGVVIQSNKFIDNLFQILDDSGILLNAQYNYWGTDDGAEIASLVSDNVVYAPWFTDEEMTISTIGQSAPETDPETGMVETEIEEEVTLSDGEITVTLPEEVVVSTEDTEWDGTITPPTIKVSPSVAPSTPGLTQTVSKVIEVGFSGAKLIFSKAVKIVIPGETGKKVGYSDGTTFTKITTECGENSQTWADTLPDGGECYYDNGADIIIWTKHFTEFMTFDESDPEVPNLELYWYTPDFLQPEEFLNFFARFSDGSGVAYVQIRYIFTALLGSGGGFESEPDYENITLIDGTIYNGTWSPTDLPVPQTDGYYQIRLKADDLSGEGHEYYYPDEPDWLLTVTYDGTEPVTELLLDGSNYSDFITSTTEITLDATDPDLDDAGDYTPSDVNYIEYKIDGSYEEYTEAITITGDDGDYTVYYKSTDNAGNEEEEKSTTLTLDNTAPVTTDDSDSDWTDSDVTVTLSPTDDGSGVAHTYYCTYNDGEPECDPTIEGTSVSVTCAADEVCEQYVRYYSEDNLGNEESIKTSNLIRIDKEETTTSLTLGTPNDDPYITSATEITLECDDGDGSGCETIYYKINGGDETEYSEAFTISGTDGDYIIEYYSVDAVGNIETTNQETLTLDNTEPTTTDDSSSYIDWQPSDVTITLTPSDTGSGVADTYYCIDETGTCTPTISGTSVDVTCVADSVCEQYVRYYSVDDVENSEEVKTSGLIRIDKQNPISTILSPEESSIFASDFDASVEDSDSDGSGLATCEYQITSNGVITQVWTSRTCGEDITITVGDSMNCRDEGDDICKLEIRSTDNVANVATVVERTFSIDYSNPPSILSSGPSGTIWNSFATLNVETNKPATCKYDTVYKSDYDAMSYDMTTTGNLIHSEELTGLTDTSYNYYVICKDTVNNEMTYPASISFDVDTRENFVVTIPETKGDYLKNGWNQFFLPSFVLEDSELEYNEELEGYEVEDVLESIEGNYNSLYHFDGSEWTSYVPGREVNDLTHFNGGGFPYFINMNVSGERIEIE